MAAAGNIFDEWWAKLAEGLNTQAEGMCWLWTRGRSGRGSSQYGIIRIRLPGETKTKPISTQSILHGQGT